MGQTYRKHKGKWVTLEEFKKLTAGATDDANPFDEKHPRRDMVSGEGADAVAQARGVLERGDYQEMGAFLAEHREEPTPKGKDARIAALEAFIAGETE